MTHWNWREELTQDPYNLKISEKDGFYLFKYSQLNSDFSEEICREARGIILDSCNNWKVVRLAFYKFFNYGEQFADQIDWESAIATEKIDGSIMTLWFARGEWHLSTNGTIDATDVQVNISNYSFKQVFDMAAEKCGLDYSKLNPQNNYTFELVSPYNKVVISYPETTLYHILTRDMTTLKEIDEDIGVQKPKMYSFNVKQKDKYFDIVNKMDKTHEGIVIKDKNNHRVKIKTPLYFELHKTINNGHITLERALDIIRKNESSEFLVYFPEYTAYFKEICLYYVTFFNFCFKIEKQVEGWIEDHIYQYISETKTEEEVKKEFRGLFAKWVKENILPRWYFVCYAAYDSKTEIINNLSSKKIIEIMDMGREIKIENFIQ